MDWLKTLETAEVKGDVKKEEEQKEQAVIIVGEYDSRIVFGRGPIIEGDKEAGLGSDEAGPTSIAPEGKGLWIWEGVPGWSKSSNPEWGDDGGEPYYDGRGEWRRPTQEEALKIAAGDFSFFGEERLKKGVNL